MGFEIRSLQIDRHEPNQMTAIGLLSPDSDPTIERDIWAGAALAGVNIVTSRIVLPQPYTAKTLAGMADEISHATARLVPGSSLDVVIFGCTSASIIIGTETVKTLVKACRPGVEVTNPALAAVTACRHLELRKIAIITPYTPDVTNLTATFFAENGIEATDICCLGLSEDRLIASVTPHEIVALADGLNMKAADGIFLSCTAARSVEAISMMESRFNLPVITSNQAVLWHALRLVGNNSAIRGYGRLLA